MIKKFDNIFNDEELLFLKEQLDYNKIPTDEYGNFVDHRTDQKSGIGIHYGLGRLQFGGLFLSDSIRSKLNKIIEEFPYINLSLGHATVVEYNNKYGEPNLPVHYDHDNHDLIINFQLMSNTVWPIGVDCEAYNLKDNSAVVFNPNGFTHWRPHKKFKDGEFVTMIFFRFMNEQNPSDYSHLDYNIGDPIFKEVEEFRKSLKEI
jgi:hypothetical protein